MAVKFQRPLPWAIGDGKPFLASAEEAAAAVTIRLDFVDLQDWERVPLWALKRMLDAAGSDAGMLDSVVITGAFERFVLDWHRRVRRDA